jgi:hypothetical protein
MEQLRDYIEKKFGINEKRFLEVLEKSPGAEGYILGNLGEDLFKEYAESKDFEALRIKEKPEGGNNAKSEDARGDFYIRKNPSDKDEWYVVECKGVKSNSEKRTGLTKMISCINILTKHAIAREEHLKSIYNSGKSEYERIKDEWELSNDGAFPAFNWNRTNPGPGIPNLTGLWSTKAEIEEWLKAFPPESFNEDAYWNLTAPIRLLQTHMPSTRIDSVTGIKSTGPLTSEFLPMLKN